MGESLAETMEANADNLAEAMEKLSEELGANSNIKAISYKALQHILPHSFAGLQRQASSGEQNKTMGLIISYVDAEYYNDRTNEEVSIEITDMGNMAAFLKIGAIGWATADFERETEDGFERTARIAGHKAFEEFDRSINRSKIDVIVAGRFLVSFKAHKLDFNELHEEVEDFAFRELVSLAEDR